MRRAPLFRGRLAALLVAAGFLAVALGLGGCTSVHNVLGTRTSACFRVLPEAKAAIGAKARFAGVRSLEPRALIDVVELSGTHQVEAPAHLETEGRRSTCLVAFTGNFKTKDLRRVWAPRHGPYKYAVVVVEQKNGRLLSTVLLRKMPLRFKHTFVFTNG